MQMTEGDTELMKGRSWMMKGLTAAVLAVLVCLWGVCALAAAGPGDAAVQIENAGGLRQIPGDEAYTEIHSGTGIKYDISWSKTIAPVVLDANGDELHEKYKENYFDITLTAETRRHERTTETDVVVVMDISNTMNALTVNPDTSTKINAVRSATKAFIKDFANSTYLSKRRVGVVTFNTNARRAIDMTELSAGMNLDAAVDKIVAPTADDVKYTNIEGGLQLAYNMLKSSTADYKYVVLMTDGFPTTYISGSRDNTSYIPGYDTRMSVVYGYGSYTNARGSGNVDGYFAEVSRRAPCDYGVNYSNKAALKTEAMAETIKNAGINIFTVGVGIGGMTIKYYLDAANGSSFSTVDTTGMASGQSYAIGSANDTNSYRNWLKKIAGGPMIGQDKDRYLDGDNLTAMQTNVKKILRTIEIAPLTKLSDFYVTDPMASNYIDFRYLHKANGTPAGNALSGESKKNAENTATYSSANDQIHWNLMKSGYTDPVGDGKHFAYSLTYRVRLENEKAGFVWQNAYSTNGTTTLDYQTVYDDDGEHTVVDDGRMHYMVPAVEGYKGALKLKKVDGDNNNNPMEGVQFTLVHEGANCSVCEGDAKNTDFPALTAKTDRNGYAEIDNIPSGHEYVLKETPPMGYKPLPDHRVIVSYGKTYIDSMDNELENGQIRGEDFTIVNDSAEPVDIRLKVKKNMEGGALKAGAYTFKLSGRNEFGALREETVTCDANGEALFDTIILNTKATTYYTITEIVGTEENIVYDANEWYVQLDAGHIPESSNWHVYVTIRDKKGTYNNDDDPLHIDGTDTTIDDPAVILLGESQTFSNAVREPVVVQLAARKTLHDFSGAPTALEAGRFYFELRDSEGKLIDTVANTAGVTTTEVKFKALTLSDAGVYTYTIEELWDPEGAHHDPDILYDRSQWTATVTVDAPADLTKSDALAATVEYSFAESENGVAADFENGMRGPASLTIHARKLFNGKKPAGDRFEFELVKLVDGKEELIETAFNDADGLITFDTIVFEGTPDDPNTSPAGRHHYLVREKKGKSNSVVYDTTVYRIDATVYEMLDEPNYGVICSVTKIVGGKETAVYGGYGADVVIPVDSNENIAFSNVSVPMTGDDAQLTLWAAVLAVSGICIVLMAKRRRA